MPLPRVHTQADTRDYNLPMYGQKGEYSLSANVRVPYFVTLLDLRRVARELKTHEEVKPSLDNSYNLVELFQRNIDPERVKKDIVDGYLRNPNKLKFFNSITIVLLPKDEKGRIAQNFMNYEWNDPMIPYQEGNEFDSFFSGDHASKVVFGGVQFVATESASLSRLRWDQLRVDAVAVDGQHRLKALKLWMGDNNYELGDVAKATRIPVIFLMLHELAGFKAAAGSSVAIKSIAREIFTDLNKNAKEVDLATQIILDDRSLASCCVRSLITQSTCEDSESLLPLSMLRWQDANNRFDQRHYVNSLVNLHLIVEDLLDLEPLTKEAMNRTKVISYLKSLKQLVGVINPSSGQREIISDGMDIEAFYEREFIDAESGDAVAPFSGLPPQFLRPAVQGFSANFSSWILQILTEFSPYRDLLSYARNNDLICGEFAKYLAQPNEHQSQLALELGAKYGENWKEALLENHVDFIERSFKGVGNRSLGDHWAFKTIFQKAVMRVGKILFFDTPEEERSRFGTPSDYIAFLDFLHQANILRVLADLPGHSYKLWTFISVNYGNNKIKVATTSENRIQSILLLWYFAARYAKNTGKSIRSGTAQSESEISASDILREFSFKRSMVDWPQVSDCYEMLFEEFSRSAKIIRGANDSITLSDSERRSIALSRLSAVFEAGLVAHSPLQASDRI